MAPLTFADLHNMVMFLSKSDASAGFNQIMDFLNAHTIQYALTVNPIIYVSCIKQFWATAKVKKVNGVNQLQALIDGKKVVVSKAIIRRDLRLDDADGIECFLNVEIFEELARMGYTKPSPKLTFYKAFFFAQWKFLIHTLVQCISAKRTVWNEFSYSIASAIIYLATDHQVDNMTSYMTKYTSPALTQKVAELEHDRNSQALEILQLKKRVKMLEWRKKSMTLGGCIQTGEKIAAIDADDGITLVDEEFDVEVAIYVESQGRLHQKEVNAASKEVSTVSAAPELVSAVEQTIFDDEDVTMTMAQTLIKLKVEKARILDEQMAQKLHDEEVQKATARDKQERTNKERALVLQKQYNDKEDTID
nr:hypothetical protein [Tanacetum cinerariifolium]